MRQYDLLREFTATRTANLHALDQLGLDEENLNAWRTIPISARSAFVSSSPRGSCTTGRISDRSRALSPRDMALVVLAIASVTLRAQQPTAPGAGTPTLIIEAGTFH